MTFFKFLLTTILIIVTQEYVSPSKCNVTKQFYNYLNFTCQQCPYNSTPTSLGFCNCTSGYYQDRTIIGFNHSLACKPFINSASNNVHLFANADGSLNGTEISCASNSYPNNNKDQCIPCPSPNMIYNTTTNQCQCVTGIKILNTCGTYSFGNYSNSTLIFANYAWNIANAGCLNSLDEQSCNLLLNMCASTNYDQTNPFCLLITDNPNITNLYRYQFQSNELNLNQIGISVSTSEFLNTTSYQNKLDFYLSVFDKYGVQKDFRLLQKDLFLCDASLLDSEQLLSFGLGFFKTCTLSAPISQTEFYDLYLKTSNGSFAAIPIKITRSDGTIIYVRRFTTSTDLLSRLQLQTPTIPLYNYPSLTMQFTSSTNLLTPILILSTSSNPVTIQNTSTTSASNFVLLIPFIIFNIVIFIYYIIQMQKYVKYNPQQQYELYYCFRVLWEAFWVAIRCWSIGLWIWLCGVSTYAFCFYKFQKTLYMFLPDPSDPNNKFQYYTPFIAVFYTTLSLNIINIIELVYRISQTEYFILDWEKPKPLPTKFNINTEQTKQKSSIWRKLFLVNELYQLSVKRISSLQFSLLFLGLFLEGLKWSNLEYMIPNTNTKQTSQSTNIILCFFMNTIIFVIISGCQIYGRKIISVWFPLPQENFIDLCCLSNISIFIFDQKLHGYYIHGMNPLGRSEGTLQYIENIFQKQSQNHGRNRGLVEEDFDALQTFEIIIPKLLRFQFNKMYMEVLKATLTNTQVFNTFINKPVPDMAMKDYDFIETQNQAMVNTFRLYLEEIKKTKFQIQEKDCITKFIEWPPNELFYQKLPLFYRDPNYSFINVFLSGNQWALVINDICIYNFWFYILNSTYQAIFLTIVFSKLLFGIYQEYRMKRNLASNTLVDDKFFI